jgi:hypothetical protein
MNFSDSLRCDCCGWTGAVVVKGSKVVCANPVECADNLVMNDALEATMVDMEAQTAYENGNAFWA